MIPFALSQNLANNLESVLNVVVMLPKLDTRPPRFLVPEGVLYPWTEKFAELQYYCIEHIRVNSIHGVRCSIEKVHKTAEDSHLPHGKSLWRRK